MAIDFPANPTNGQVYGNWIYDSSITAWRNVNTDTGIGTLNAMGMKNVVPASVNVGSGSATVNANGTVAYTGVSSISLNSIFTSTYTSYKIVVEHILTADTGLMIRFRTGGTDNTSGVYNNHHAFWGTGGNGANIIANSTTFGGLFGHRTQRGIYEIIDPQKATRTVATFFGAAESSAGATEQHTSSAIHKSDTQFDGFTLYPNTGTFTGTLTVYGYTN